MPSSAQHNATDTGASNTAMGCWDCVAQHPPIFADGVSSAAMGPAAMVHAGLADLPASVLDQLVRLLPREDRRSLRATCGGLRAAMNRRCTTIHVSAAALAANTSAPAAAAAAAVAGAAASATPTPTPSAAPRGARLQHAFPKAVSFVASDDESDGGAVTDGALMGLLLHCRPLLERLQVGSGRKLVGNRETKLAAARLISRIKRFGKRSGSWHQLQPGHSDGAEPAFYAVLVQEISSHWLSRAGSGPSALRPAVGWRAALLCAPLPTACVPDAAQVRRTGR